MMKRIYLSLATSLKDGYHLSLSFSERQLLLLLGDIASLALALFIAQWVQSLFSSQLNRPVEMMIDRLIWLFSLALLWILLAVVNEIYDLQTANQPNLVITRLILTSFEITILYLFIFFIMGRPLNIIIPFFDYPLSVNTPPPRIISIVFLTMSLVFVILWRLLYIQLIFSMRRKVLIVGAGKAGRALVQALQQTPLNYELLGFIDDDKGKHGCIFDGVPVLGGCDDLQRQIETYRVNEVILAITNEIHTDMLRALMSCYERGLVIKPLPVLYEEALERVPVEYLGTQWFPRPLWQTSRTLSYRLVKRLVDLILGLMGLVILGLLLPFLALAIYLDSPGPIFYTQIRLGRNGRTFHVFKLRSMILNAEKDGKPRWAIQNDNRVTRTGRILRRTRLDELPQFLNVLKGEMSIVGPRPERPQFVEQLQKDIPFYRARLAVKPGLTGWAQIKYSYGNNVEDALYKLQYDLYYIKNRSLALDILIILRTIRVILTFQGT